MNSELKGVSVDHNLESNVELIESFECLLLELQQRGMAQCGTRTEDSDGEVEFQIAVFGDG